MGSVLKLTLGVKFLGLGLTFFESLFKLHLATLKFSKFVGEVDKMRHGRGYVSSVRIFDAHR